MADDTRAGIGTRARVLAGAVRATSRLARLGGRGGSVLGGRVGLLLDRDALEHLGAWRRVLLVSGTNGKTTTTTLLTAALSTAGPVAHNVMGANLAPGLVTALASRPDAPTAALEVDEAALTLVLPRLAPQVVTLLNLSRDQMDRYGEVRMLSARWRTAIEQAGGLTVVANADDPLVVWAASACPHTVWVAAGSRWRRDASACPRCGGGIAWGEDGSWACSCGFARPRPDAWVAGGVLHTAGGERARVRLALPGRFNLGNAAMAAAAARVAGVPLARAVEAMGAVTDVAGRYRHVRVGGRSVRLLLAKNPAGWQEALELVAPPPAPVVIGINARIADGEDPSWLWDVPFERLGGRLVVASGERAWDLAVRLHYAEVEHVVRPGNPLAAVEAVGGAGDRPGDPIDLIANYTAFQAALGAAG